MRLETSPNWSARHTRLRYQAVLLSLGFMLVVTLGIDKVKIPGFFEFSEPPSADLVEIGALIFALFSVASFIVQDNLERHLSPNVLKRLKVGISYIQKKLTGNEELIASTKLTYERFLSLFDDIRPASNDENPWRGESLYWIEDGLYRPVVNELRSVLSQINQPLNTFLADLNAAKMHFPNVLPLYEGLQHQAQGIQTSLSGIKYSPKSQKGSSPESHGFDPLDIDFEANVLSRLLDRINQMNTDILALKKIESHYRWKVNFLRMFLSFTMPLIASVLFIIFGAYKWVL